MIPRCKGVGNATPPSGTAESDAAPGAGLSSALGPLAGWGAHRQDLSPSSPGQDRTCRARGCYLTGPIVPRSHPVLPVPEPRPPAATVAAACAHPAEPPAAPPPRRRPRLRPAPPSFSHRVAAPPPAPSRRAGSRRPGPGDPPPPHRNSTLYESVASRMLNSASAAAFISGRSGDAAPRAARRGCEQGEKWASLRSVA
jgi:hypothetical protein